MFDYDWFFGTAYEDQQRAARFRVSIRKFRNLDPEQAFENPAFVDYFNALECRTLIHLRDGFTCELKELVEDVASKSQFVFECEPVDELYKVGAYIVTVPFEEIARVEVYAVHPDHKPENKPLIPGFRATHWEEAKSAPA